MNKFVLTAMVMCAAIASQAATSWTFRSYDSFPINDGYKAKTVDGTSSGLLGAGYTVYFISADQEAWGLKNGDTSYYTTQAAFLSNLRNGQSAIEAAGNALLGETTTKGDGLFNEKSVSLNDSNLYYDQWYGTGDTDQLHAFMAVIVGSDVFLSEDNSGSKGEANIDFAAYNSNTRIDIDGTGSYDGYPGWFSFSSTESIPEPTSGMLMLLGIAGLALKRKLV